MTTCLLIIDPQVDFCEGGALPVKGATADLGRLAKMISKHRDNIDSIQITMDSHYHFHIAHSCWWKENPIPYTVISAEDVDKGTWTPHYPSLRDWALYYTKQLQINNRYQLRIWPDHCIIGSWGHQIYPPLLASISDWEKSHVVYARRVLKGSNSHTEHFSAIKADVERPDDPETGINKSLVNALKSYNTILIAGEALSHCVASTVRDLVMEFSGDARNVVLLEDACSNVVGCESLGEKFVVDMVDRGMEVSQTTTFFEHRDHNGNDNKKGSN